MYKVTYIVQKYVDMVTYVIAGPKRRIVPWLCRSIQCYSRIIIPIAAMLICTCILQFLVYSFPDLWTFVQTLGLCHVL